MAQYFVPATSATGELVGYRVSPNNRQPRLQQLGLLPTDIITAVHAFPLIQLENRMRALQRLRDDEFASITFIRDGNKLINITIMPDVEVSGSYRD
jgi:type II secretory pathway component PulC